MATEQTYVNAREDLATVTPLYITARQDWCEGRISQHVWSMYRDTLLAIEADLTVCGFRLVQEPAGWFLKDTDTFNDWGTLPTRFATAKEAEAYAVRCDSFKRGRSSDI